MNWFQRFFYRQEKFAHTGMFGVGPGHPTTMQISPDQISIEAYRKLSVAYRCVDIISGAVAGIRLNLFQGDKEIVRHPIIDLLKKPNPLQTYMTFTKCAISYFALHGNSFIQGMVAGNAKKPFRLICHRTSRFKVVPGENFIPSAYILRIRQDKELKFEVDIMGRSEILHLKTFNPLDDWWGQSPVVPAATDVDTLNAANRWNLSLLQNSARPSGVFFYTGEGQLDDVKKRLLRKDIERLWSGEVDAGKPLILGGKIDFKELSLTPKDMDFLSSKKVSKADLALAFGVPAQLVGVEGSQTFANFAQAQLSFYLDTAIPIAKMWVQALNNWLVPAFGREGLELKIDEDSITALEPIRKIQWEKASTASWLTPNEKRELTGFVPYDPTEDPADKIYINASEVPIGEDDDFEIIEPESDNDKAFNLNSRRGKRQFWMSENRRRNGFTKRMRSQLNAAFKKEAKEIINAIEGAQSDDMIEMIIKEVIADNKISFEPIFDKNISTSMRSFGISTIRAMDKKAAIDKLEFSIRRFIDQEVGDKITKIARTSQKRVVKKVREAILAAEVEGQSVVEAAKAIEKIYKDFTTKRSLVIARTEIHNAAMKGSIEGAKATGVSNLQKEWVSNFQAGFRENHGAAMDGEKVGIDEKFQVPSPTGSDVSMDGPGDASAPAEQIINCSCVLVYSGT